jgi:hypothetical protein
VSHLGSIVDPDYLLALSVQQHFVNFLKKEDFLDVAIMRDLINDVFVFSVLGVHAIRLLSVLLDLMLDKVRSQVLKFDIVTGVFVTAVE